MERELFIDVADGFDVRARVVDLGANSPVVVFVQGLSGRPWEGEERREQDNDDFDDGFARLACALAVLGFSTVRFHLYEQNRPGARTWRQATLRTYASDIVAVIAHVRSTMPDRPIATVGHSYGASAILLTETRHFETAVLLDPAALDDSRLSPNNWHWDEASNLHRFVERENGRWCPDERLVVEREVDLVKALQSFDRPFAIVLAGESGFADVRTAGFEDADVLRRCVTVDGAEHHFPFHQHVVAREIVDWLSAVGING